MSVHDPEWGAGLAGLPLRFAAGVFALGAGLRGHAYDRGWLSELRAPAPVISVGNLVVGGSGKTPLVAALARRLHARGRRVAILSRGYGARPTPDPRAPRVVAVDGVLREPPERAGDEPTLLAQTGASVVIGADRRVSARLAVDTLGADVLLLDDGFQHRGLARDLDLLVLDARRPLGNGRLLPAGPLREPAEAGLRADLLVRHHGPSPGPACWPDGALPEALAARACVDVAIAPRLLRRLDDGSETAAETLGGARVGLIAGIARPERFVATVEGLGATVVGTAFFADHAWIPPDTLAERVAALRAAGAERVLVTEKDAARLTAGAAPAGLELLAIELVWRAGLDRLDAALDRVLGGALGGPTGADDGVEAPCDTR